MKFECDSCHAQYMIADEKVGKRGVKVKCKKCQHVIIVRPDRAEAAADKEKEAAKAEAAVEKPQVTLAQPPPPGLDLGGLDSDGAGDGDPFASGGATDPNAPALAAAPPPPPEASEPDAPPFAAPPSGEPELTGPGLKPAPVSMFDQTQLTQNPMAGQMSEPEGRRGDDRTELAQPPQMTAPPPPPERPEPTMVVRQENQTPSEPEAPSAEPPAVEAPPAVAAAPAGPEGDELGDQLSGAFSAMFDASVPGQTESDESDEDDHRGPTRVLDVNAVDALRKQATRPDPNALEPGMVAISRKSNDSPASSPAGADDGPAEQVWHAAIDDQDVGPLSVAEVGRHIEAGRVDRESLVWKIGMDDWIPAGEVPAIRALFDKVPMPRIARVEEEPKQRSGGFDPGFLNARTDDGPPSGGSPFDESDDQSWRPHGLTDVYQAANLAEVAGMGGGLNALSVGMSGPVKSPLPSMSQSSLSPMSASASSSNEPEWRPGAASALSALVQDEIKRIDNGPASGADDDLSPADDASINAPIFGSMSAGKDLDAGPAVGDSMPRASSRPPTSLSTASYEPPPSSYSPPPSPFLSKTPTEAPPRFSTNMILAGVGGLVAILVVVVVVAVAFSKPKDEGPKLVIGPDGKPYMMGADSKLIALSGGEPEKKAEPEKKPEVLAATGTLPADAKDPAKDPAADPAADGKLADATPPPAADDKGTGPATAKKIADKAQVQAKARDSKPPPEKVEKETKPPPRGGCDPVLDFDCKPGAAAAPKAGGDVKETLAKTDVLMVVKTNMSKVEGCGRKNKTGGVIKMSWKIQPNGKTSDVQVSDSKFAGTPVGSCVANEIKGWKFPQSKATTPVSFPMKLDG